MIGDRCQLIAGNPEATQNAAQLRAYSRSNSSESMRRLDDLRVDSYQQAPSWQQDGSHTERRGTLDDIDYMSNEEDGSMQEISGSDTTRGAPRAARSTLMLSGSDHDIDDSILTDVAMPCFLSKACHSDFHCRSSTECINWCLPASLPRMFCGV